MILRRTLPLLFLLLAMLQLPAQQRKMPLWSGEELREDFEFLYRVLEKAHPSLYWYTSREEIQKYFTWAYNSIGDSMNEVQFRNLVAYAVSKIRCGHTAVKPSKYFSRYQERTRAPFFPFNVRVWNDTMAVSHSWWKGDSALLRGSLITAIDGKPVKEILHALYEFMSIDGYSNGVNEIRLSYAFPANFRNIYGSASSFRVKYIAPDGREQEKSFAAYSPFADTMNRSERRSDTASKRPQVSWKIRKKNELRAARSFRIDTLNKAGIMEVNTFSNGYKFRSFYKESFRRLSEQKITNLVIDVRDNGGGNIRNYIMLTRYLRHTSFRVADTVSAITRKMPTIKYMQAGFLNDLYMRLSARKKRDGRYHFIYFEKHRYAPKKKGHYNGNLYVITSGQTFSAATLFASALKGQSNCTIVGEETGGGAYGNNGMLIPQVTLPHSKIRITLPIFRMVITTDETLKGRGVLPDVEVTPSVEAIRKGEDAKLKRVIQLMGQKEIYNSSEK